MLGLITGLRIIESDKCYTTRIVVRGIADKRRPNGKKPLYRRVVIHTPKMYRTGNDIICHPSLMNDLKRVAFSVPSLPKIEWR